MKLIVLFISAFFFIIEANSQNGAKRIKNYEYVDISSRKVVMNYERNYINDSVFCDVRLYCNDTVQERVLYDTFKVINGKWYCTRNGENELFFDTHKFGRKTPSILKAINFKGNAYGYGPCNSFTPICKEKLHNKMYYKFFVNYGDCNGGIPTKRLFNPEYWLFDKNIGFVFIKDKVHVYQMRVLEYY